MNERIFIKDWLKLKPYSGQAFTDSYYLKVCNEVRNVLVKNGSLVLGGDFPNKEQVTLISCFLTSYFEDVISDSGVWKTFISIHEKMYGKKLPFFPTDDYFIGEINQQDVSFLVWYILNSLQKEIIVLSNDPSIELASVAVMEIFERHFEYAPENEELKKFYSIDSTEVNYFEARELIDTILFETYLFYPDTALILQKNELEILKGKRSELILDYLRDNRDVLVHKLHTSLLALKGKEWAAAILGEDHLLYNDFINMSSRIVGYFLYKGQDDSLIFLEYVATGNRFDLTKKSYEYGEGLTQIDTILYLGIVKWQQEWWFSGVSFTIPYDIELLEEERNSFASKRQIELLGYDWEKAKELLNAQLQSFLKFNNGSPIAFMPVSKFQDFSRSFYNYYNSSLHLSAKEIGDSYKNLGKANFIGSLDMEKDSFSENEAEGLIFFNTNSGLEMAWGVNDAFKLSDNPTFDENEIEDCLMDLLSSEEMSTELFLFAIEHAKKVLLSYQNGRRAQFLENLDFLLRFFKTENYKTNPAITLVGK